MTGTSDPICEECGTDHDGLFPGSFAAEMECLHIQIRDLGGVLKDEFMALSQKVYGHLERGIRRYFRS